MVDSGRCTMLYDGNEDEYADFYDYTGDDGEAVSAGGEFWGGVEGSLLAWRDCWDRQDASYNPCQHPDWPLSAAPHAICLPLNAGCMHFPKT